MLRTAVLVFVLGLLQGGTVVQRPGETGNGYLLPNGWRISPTGKHVETEDLVLKILSSPDRRVIVALNSHRFSTWSTH